LNLLRPIGADPVEVLLDAVVERGGRDPAEVLLHAGVAGAGAGWVAGDVVVGVGGGDDAVVGGDGVITANRRGVLYAAVNDCERDAKLA
jgi:hypothetical protein